MGARRRYAGGRCLRHRSRRASSWAKTMRTLTVVASGTEYELLASKTRLPSCFAVKTDRLSAHLQGDDAIRFRADYEAIRLQFPAGRRIKRSLSYGTKADIAGSQLKRRLTMATLVKVTQDGRKLEVVGLAILLDGQLEAFELIEVKLHPNRRAICSCCPRLRIWLDVSRLTREEAAIVEAAFKEAEAANSWPVPRPSTSDSGSRPCGRRGNRASNKLLRRFLNWQRQRAPVGPLRLQRRSNCEIVAFRADRRGAAA